MRGIEDDEAVDLVDLPSEAFLADHARRDALGLLSADPEQPSELAERDVVVHARCGEQVVLDDGVPEHRDSTLGKHLRLVWLKGFLECIDFALLEDPLEVHLLEESVHGEVSRAFVLCARVWQSVKIMKRGEGKRTL